MPTLTEAQCKAAKPKEKPYKLFDGGGLYLWVSSKGARTWRVAYRYEAKQKTISLGDYPLLSLAQARIKLSEVKSALLAGDNPMQKRAQAREERKALKNALLFKDACAQYWDNRKDISEGYRAKSIRGIEMHLYPTLGHRLINTITRDDLLDAFRIMDAKGRHVFLRKVKSVVALVFDWCLENGNIENNPVRSINTERAFSRPCVESFAAVELNEVSDLLKRINLEGDLTSVLACKMLAYTWVRTKELRFMEWTEIDGDVWRIPGKKMKRRKDHIVPLSKQALEVLEKIQARNHGGRFVFHSELGKDRAISENTILYLLHRIGYKGRMTGHGWRSVGSTWANEKGYSVDAIERQLSHVPDNKIRAVYNRAEYLPERRKMLQDWADWLDSIC